MNTNLTFQLQVCDGEPLCNSDTVVITVTPPQAVVDAAGNVIVNGPTSSRQSKKAFVVEVSNAGTSTLTVSPADVDATVLVNGSPLGTVTAQKDTPKTLSPGAKVRFRFEWSYTGLTAGASVQYNACVDVAGDINSGNDCGRRYRHGQVGRQGHGRI